VPDNKADAVAYQRLQPSDGSIKSIHPEIVDFNSGHGRSEFKPSGVVDYVEDFEWAKTPI
jgi:hypothetical protein